MAMNVKTRIDKRQYAAATLIKYAAEIDAIDYKAATDEEFEEMVALAQGAAQGSLLLMELERLTELVQQTVELQIYTMQQAAAWLGMSVAGATAAAREKRLPSTKPGHDLVVTHKNLVAFHEKRQQ